MNPLAVLGRYLVLAIVLPGMVVATSIALLFPQLRDAAVTLPPSELRLWIIIGVVPVIAIVNGHLAWFLERWILDPLLWRLTAGSTSLWSSESRALVRARSTIVVAAEVKGISRDVYEQALGEFVGVLNSSTGLFATAFVFIILAVLDINGIRLESSLIFTRGEFLVSLIVVCSSLLGLLFLCPIQKAYYVQALEVLKLAVEA